VRWFVPIVALGLILLLVPLCARAEEDRAFFVEPPGDVVIDTTYVGQHELDLEVVWGQNATDYEVALESPLLKTRLYGRTHETLPAGTHGGIGLQMNETAPPGVYNLTLYLNYTDDAGAFVSSVFHFSIHHVKVVELKKASVVPGSPNIFRVEVELYRDCSELEVIFDSGEGIQLSRENFVSQNLGPGNYTFEAEMTPGTWFAHRDEDWVGYHVIAHFGTRYVETIKYFIDPQTLREAGVGSPWTVPVATTFVVVLVMVTVALVVRHRRKHPPPVRPKQ
jgi:hypothetical protein